jgi:hypothetical protein
MQAVFSAARRYVIARIKQAKERPAAFAGRLCFLFLRKPTGIIIVRYCPPV